MIGREPLEAIGIEIPKPGFFGSVPHSGGRRFGKHYGTCEGHPSLQFSRRCGAPLELKAVGSDQMRGLSVGEPIEVACLGCRFRFVIGNNTREATLEWMRMALGFFLDATLYGACRENVFILPSDAITVCKPDEVQVFDQGGELQLCLDDESPFKNLGAFIVPTWKEYRLVVIRGENCDEEGLRDLILDALLLMTELEKSFQKAITRAAQLASSASEAFHPTTRRQREGS